MYQCGHGVVDGAHYLVRHLHDRYLHAGMYQVLCHLQADESSAHNHGALHLLPGQILLDAVRVVHVPEREDAFRVDAFQWGAHRRGSRREQQLVVIFLIDSSVGGADGHFFPLQVDSCCFRMDAHVNVEALSECFGSLYEEPVTVFDDATYIIRQAAVGIRDICTSFQQDDFRFLCVSADACRCCGSSCHTSYNDDFHTAIHFFMVVIFYWKLLQS